MVLQIHDVIVHFGNTADVCYQLILLDRHNPSVLFGHLRWLDLFQGGVATVEICKPKWHHKQKNAVGASAGIGKDFISFEF